eukprot:TRINITY_DN2426_c0_g1_i1.p1 TRINITY_DN2426_c0_g1~~TRINITY_DN2426_c0_g1_i1.p1  ORF type:complete len:222 (+),score=29.87 TRINITY_DN2426_c0_g1_i1:29-694(+)
MPVTINVLFGDRAFQFNGNLFDRISTIKHEIKNRTNIPIEQQRLKKGEQELEDDRSLSHYGNEERLYLHLERFAPVIREEFDVLLRKCEGLEERLRALEARRPISDWVDCQFNRNDYKVTQYFQKPQYRKIDGRVELRGALQRTGATVGYGTVILENLPPPYQWCRFMASRKSWTANIPNYISLQINKGCVLEPCPDNSNDCLIANEDHIYFDNTFYMSHE